MQYFNKRVCFLYQYLDKNAQQTTHFILSIKKNLIEIYGLWVLKRKRNRLILANNLIEQMSDMITKYCFLKS